MLSLTPLWWILATMPEAFTLEQVPTVLPLWEIYANVLRQHGYSVATGNIQAEQYGVPQTRKRAVARRLPRPAHPRPADADALQVLLPHPGQAGRGVWRSGCRWRRRSAGAWCCARTRRSLLAPRGWC